MSEEKRKMCIRDRVVLAVAAGPALAAHHLGLNGHLLAQSEPGDALAQGCDLAGDLVPLGDGVLGERVFPVVHVDVGAAHADLLDFHQHFSGLRLGGGHFPEFDDAGGGHNLL